MAMFARVAIAAAAVLAIGLAWVNLGPSNGVGAAPTPTTVPTATPAPTAIPALGPGLLDAGRYQLNATIPMAITVPAGWTALGDTTITKNEFTTTELAFSVWDMVNTYADPCRDHTLVSPSPGPEVDDIADALAKQPGIEAGPPRDVTIDGYSGKVVELTVTADITTCLGGKDGFWLWYGDGDRRYVQGTNEEDRLYILDVEGARYTFAAAVQQATSATDRAELDAIIESIDIQP